MSTYTTLSKKVKSNKIVARTATQIKKIYQAFIVPDPYLSFYVTSENKYITYCDMMICRPNDMSLSSPEYFSIKRFGSSAL